MDEDEHLELYGREPSMGSIYHLSDKGVRAKPREFPIGFHQPARREDRMKEVKLWYLASPYTNHPHGREIAFRDELPMTTTGKVQRRVLRLQEEARASGLA